MSKAKPNPRRAPSNSGLTEADELALIESRALLVPIMERRAMMGAHEAEKVLDLDRKLANRIAPTDPAALVEQARYIHETLGQDIERGRLRVVERQDQADAQAAAMREARDKRNAETAARAEEFARRHMAKCAVDEVIL